jgi:hypothetical protein
MTRNELIDMAVREAMEQQPKPNIWCACLSCRGRLALRVHNLWPPILSRTEENAGCPGCLLCQPETTETA